MTVMPAAAADAARLRYDAHVALLTARHIVARLAQLEDGRPKHLVLLSSGATSAAVLAAALAHEGASEPPAPPGRHVDLAALLRELAELAGAARRAGVRIHTVDVRDPASLEGVRRLK